ncbi:MAG: hypothetical protein D6690_12300 [Nitrospirae bacterium]|nr:MAG: hypothetical protein D6690_12300 [Nitrospirota bacterium]
MDPFKRKGEEVTALNEGGIPMKGRTGTADQHWASGLGGIKGTKLVARIGRAHRIAQAPWNKWRYRFLEGGNASRGLPLQELDGDNLQLIIRSRQQVGRCLDKGRKTPTPRSVPEPN